MTPGNYTQFYCKILLREAETIPREVIVVGAGVIGLEYASMLGALNVKVTAIDQRPTMIDFVDHEILPKEQESANSSSKTCQ